VVQNVKQDDKIDNSGKNGYPQLKEWHSSVHHKQTIDFLISERGARRVPSRPTERLPAGAFLILQMAYWWPRLKFGWAGGANNIKNIKKK
jgi:hypothetical protein